MKEKLTFVHADHSFLKEKQNNKHFFVFQNYSIAWLVVKTERLIGWGIFLEKVKYIQWCMDGDIDALGICGVLFWFGFVALLFWLFFLKQNSGFKQNSF